MTNQMLLNSKWKPNKRVAVLFFILKIKNKYVCMYVCIDARILLFIDSMNLAVILYLTTISHLTIARKHQ